MLGRLGITLSLVFSCVKSQFSFLYRNPVEMEEPLSCSPGRAPFSVVWGQPVQGKEGGRGTGVSSLLPHPSTSPALRCMVFLNSCPVSTQNQGYVQCLYVLLSLPTPTPSGVMCGSLSFLFVFFQVSFEMFLRRIVISLCAKAASLFPLPETKVKLGQPFFMIFVVVPSPLTFSSMMCFEPAMLE